MSASSVIGSGTVVRGSVDGEGSLEILGRVEGDVNVAGDVLVGEGGAVLGNITGVKISVQGCVQGDLRGSEAVLVERGGKVAGDLNAPRIGVESGALVRGSVRTEGEAALTPVRHAQAADVRPAKLVAKTAARTETKPIALAAARGAVLPDSPKAEAAPVARAQEAKQEPAVRRPPPPVVPSLGRGAKAKRRKS